MPNLPAFAVEAIKQAVIDAGFAGFIRQCHLGDNPQLVEVILDLDANPRSDVTTVTLLFGKCPYDRYYYAVDSYVFLDVDRTIRQILVSKVDLVLAGQSDYHRLGTGCNEDQIDAGIAAMKQRKSQLLRMKRRRKTGLSPVETEELGIITNAIDYGSSWWEARMLNPRYSVSDLFRYDPAAAYAYDRTRLAAWNNVCALFPEPTNEGPSAWAVDLANLTNAAAASLVKCFGGDAIPKVEPSLFDRMDRWLR